MNLSVITSIFFTIFIAVDPFGLIPVFIVFITKYTPAERRRIIFKTVLTSLIVFLFFIYSGRFILTTLAISPGSFAISGGILLFLVSVDMIFAKPSRTALQLDNISDIDKEDVSVFPLAIPMISGPGTIAALMMFSSQVKGDMLLLVIITAVSVLVLSITMLVMFSSIYIERLLGKTGISIIQRIMGLILSALAVQFIINGLNQIGIIKL